MLNRLAWAVATLALRLVTPVLVCVFRFVPDRGLDEHECYRGRWFERLLTRFIPYRDIVKTSADGSRSLYLRRFFLTPRKWPIRFFLHHIAMSDTDRDPHSHPWDFTSAILKGAYVEDLDVDPGPDDFRLALPGCVLENPAEHIHRVTVLEPVWTLVLTKRAHREWGFHDAGGMTPWRQYLGLEGAATEPEDVIKGAD